MIIRLSAHVSEKVQQLDGDGTGIRHKVVLRGSDIPGRIALLVDESTFARLAPGHMVAVTLDIGGPDDPPPRDLWARLDDDPDDPV